MTIEQLFFEIVSCEQAILAEKAKNGGREGSTLCFGLKMRLEAFTDLLEKYY